MSDIDADIRKDQELKAMRADIIIDTGCGQQVADPLRADISLMSLVTSFGQIPESAYISVGLIPHRLNQYGWGII
jgi:hypothetical protein